MDDQWIYPSESQAGAAARLDELQREQDALWVQLRNEEEPERRMELLAEFGENRAAIEALTAQLASGAGRVGGAAEPGVAYRVEILDSTDHPPAPREYRPPAGQDERADGPPEGEGMETLAGRLLGATGMSRTHLDRTVSGDLQHDDSSLGEAEHGDAERADLERGDDENGDLEHGDDEHGDDGHGDDERAHLEHGDDERADLERGDDEHEDLSLGGSSHDHASLDESAFGDPDEDDPSFDHPILGEAEFGDPVPDGPELDELDGPSLDDPLLAGAELDELGDASVLDDPSLDESVLDDVSFGAAAPTGRVPDELPARGRSGIDPDHVGADDTGVFGLPPGAGNGRHASVDGPVKPLSFDDSGELVELDDRTAAAFLVPDEPLGSGTNGSSSAQHIGGRPLDARYGQGPSGDRPTRPSQPAPRHRDLFGDDAAEPGGSAYGADRGLGPGRPSAGLYDGSGAPGLGAFGIDRSDRDGPRGPEVPSGIDRTGDGFPPKERPAPGPRPRHRSGGQGEGPSSGSGRGPARGPSATSQYPAVRGPRSAKTIAAAGESSGSARRSILMLVGLVAVLGTAWFLLTRGSGDGADDVASDVLASADADGPAGPSADSELDEIVSMLRASGLNSVGVERRGDAIYLTGSVPTESERAVAIGLAQGVAADVPVDGSEIVTTQPAGTQPATVEPGRAASLQNELRRVVAATPVIFGVGETAITDLHARILNSIASSLAAYPDLTVTIVGFTDDTGSESSNRQISLARAESVKAYLVSQGVPEGNLAIDARGEDVASGSQALANLERRVEFEVAGASEPAAGSGAAPIRVAIVAPSARNDLAFTQSMVDAVNVIAAERGNVEVAITDNTFVPDDAAAAIRDYATQGYDLVIAHGSQFGTPLLSIAPEFPDVAFAWGTASDTFGLPNVYAYDAAAGQGGYVMGSMATLLSTTGVVGVVGPIEVGDAQLYVNGFQAGAVAAKADATVHVGYTGSFSDLTLAAEMARSHVGSGADVLTGSAQMVVGAVSVASESNALWFGTQANQTSLAPSLVVASQVYHWEVILRQIVADIDGGVKGGRTYTAELANGGLVIEYNPDYPLPPEVRQRADEVAAGIVSGAIVVPAG